MSKPKCKNCNKIPNKIISIFLDINKYEFFCNKCFSNKVLNEPNYVNRIISIKYKEYLD